MTTSQKFTRRDFFITAMSSITTVVVSKIIDGPVTKVIEDVFNKQIPENTNLFRRFLNIETGISIYPGEGNILSVQTGNGIISQYIKTATAQFAKFLQGENPKSKRYIAVQWDDQDLQWDNEKDNLLLGGPVANIKAGMLTGYVYDKENAFPTFRSNTMLRWGFDCGEGDFGIRDRKFVTTKRIDQGKIFERPQYGIIDNNNNGRVKFLETNSNNFSCEDCLLITKVRNHESLSGRDILAIGGMHGHSIKHFSCNLIKHFNIILNSRKVGQSDYFQIMIPCNLEHYESETGTLHTNVSFRWDELEYEQV